MEAPQPMRLIENIPSQQGLRRAGGGEVALYSQNRKHPITTRIKTCAADESIDPSL